MTGEGLGGVYFDIRGAEQKRAVGFGANSETQRAVRTRRLVAPRDGWPNPAALPMAAGGSSIIENAMIYDIVADATHDLTFLAALSARRRDMSVRSTDPRGVIPDILAHAGKAGLMFGPEQSGLDNDDVVRADYLVTADLNPDYPSLNLAQAVLMMAWEWRVAAAAADGGAMPPPDDAPATIQERAFTSPIWYRPGTG